jgi:hypothetical protein
MDRHQLQEQMKAVGLSHADVARAIGCSGSTVQKQLKDLRTLKPYVEEEICRLIALRTAEINGIPFVSTVNMTQPFAQLTQHLWCVKQAKMLSEEYGIRDLDELQAEIVNRMLDLKLEPSHGVK